MSVQIMGQSLLGLLLLLALLLARSLRRLFKRRALTAPVVAPATRALLRWLPWLVLLLAAGGFALAESSLLTYHEAQNPSTISWLVIGAGLMIFANLCAALVWFAAREALAQAGPSDVEPPDPEPLASFLPRK